MSIDVGGLFSVTCKTFPNVFNGIEMIGMLLSAPLDEPDQEINSTGRPELHFIVIDCSNKIFKCDCVVLPPPS